MKYRIEHLTEYRYSQEVSASHHLARLQPRTGGGQRLESFAIDVTPDPSGIDLSGDYFGNHVHRFALHELHDALIVKTDCLVSLHGSPGQDSLASPSWREARKEVSATRTQDDRMAYEFTFASPSVPVASEYAAYAEPFFSGDTPLLEGVRALTEKIHEDFAFDPTATTVSTPLEMVLHQKRGVCQDFAHFQIACLRSLGLPACYVSGYVRTEPPPGQPRLLGADATHAWVSVYCPGLGWTEFDPTNNVIPEDTHVRVAFGRDYSDISPLRGTVVGGAGQQLTIGVTMTPIDD